MCTHVHTRLEDPERKHAASLRGVRVPYILLGGEKGEAARAVLVCDWLCDRGDEAAAFPIADTAAALYNAITMYPRLICAAVPNQRGSLLRSTTVHLAF